MKVFRNFFTRLTGLLLVGSLFVSSAGSAQALDLSAFTVQQINHYMVGPSVAHTSYSLKGKNNIESINTLEVDPDNPFIKMEVTSGGGKVLSVDTVRNQAKSIDKNGYRVIAGFNGGFYKTAAPYTGQPTGLQISAGEVISSGVTSKGVLGIMEDRRAEIKEQVKMTGKIQLPGEAGFKTLTGINRGRNKDTQKNSLFLFTSRYGPSTKTSGDEVEFVLQPKEDRLAIDQTLSATVESWSFERNSSIPAGKWVLAGSGTQASWLIDHLETGKEIQFQLNFDGGMDRAVHAVSGSELIIKDGRVTESAGSENSERAPRTMIAAKDGKLYITTFDGRQPGFSDGVTIAEGAGYLSKKGMDTAINMDGGGSTTYAAREPGNQSLSILNHPSDGFERSVSNALMIVSTAPVSQLSSFVSPLGDSIKILAKASKGIPLKGQDQYYNGVTVNTKSLKWSADSSIGKIGTSGVFTAGSKPAKGRIIVKSGTVSKTINVEVVTDMGSLSLSPKSTSVLPGSRQAFTVRGFDKGGREVYLSPGLIKWGTSGNVGKVDRNGTLTAGSSVTSGKVTAVFGKAKADAAVNIGKPPVIIEGFEDVNSLTGSAVKAKPAILALSSRPNPVREGTHALSLSYDFTGMSGTSTAYVNFKDQYGKAGRTISGKPIKLGLWVYGDSGKHWLRASFTDGKGKSFVTDFTAQGKLDWKGWKYVYANIPASSPGPIKLNQIYAAETNGKNKNKGTLYFDQLSAVYTNIK
ncbi:phosphodiester glycosidase family protein [Peribacillus kribbensis]|uniref:phosphodiester glycosidase family protein n=1 Tax=Peribacillus kribbensis TaxID=356658 RepID=UPI0004180DF3|nr:phosphodiester glycosidase family protein [Peribacillus kribbensis]